MTTRILVIEDEPDIRTLIDFTLEPEGHDVSFADSAENALPALEGDPADLVFLDIRLPGMDGWGFLDQIRARQTWREVPVVVMSAHASGDARRKAGEVAQGYLLKPFTPDQLLEWVERYS
jgi:CheY-like chemotaxis protein